MTVCPYLDGLSHVLADPGGAAMVLNYLKANGPAQLKLATRIAAMTSDQTGQLSDEQLDKRKKAGEYRILQEAHDRADTGGIE